MISQSQDLMKNYTLDLVPGAGKLKEIEKIRRKFLSIRISLLNHNVLDILKVHNIFSLEITNSTIDKILLAEALSYMKRLDSLTVNKVQFDESTRSTKVDVIPFKLRKLALKFSDTVLLNIISTETLKYFSCHTNASKTENIMKTLKAQRLLENLSLAGLAVVNIFMDPDVLNFPFSLKKLEIRNCSLLNVVESFQPFLTLHKNTLEELTIECEINKPLLCFVMANMKKLKALTTPTCFRDSQTAVEIRSTMDQVKRFTALSLQNLAFAKQLLKCFPSMEIFDVKAVTPTQWFKNFITNIAQTHPHLQQLHVPYVFDLKCPRLKELHVGKIHNENYFNEFVGQHNETLEKISIGWINGSEFSRSNTIAILNLCPKLRHISISTDSPLVTRMFIKFKRSKSFSWTLVSYFKKNQRHETEWVKVVFRFPDDEALFLQKCSVWDDQLIRDFNNVDNYGLNSYVNQFR